MSGTEPCADAGLETSAGDVGMGFLVRFEAPSHPSEAGKLSKGFPCRCDSGRTSEFSC